MKDKVIQAARELGLEVDVKPEPDTPPSAEEKRWLPAPTPSRAQLLAEALFERATVPQEIVRGARALVRGPRRIAEAALGNAAGVGSMVRAGLRPAPKTPYNERIGPHRRFTWVRMQLDAVKAIKNSLGGTVNDVMLATVAGALRRHLLRRGVDATALELKAMVPVSVRSEEARGTLGNQVAAMMAPLPVGIEDAVEPLGEDPAGEALQLVLRARLGQRRVAHVVAEVEVRVVDPARPSLAERHERELLPVARHEVEAGVDPRDDLVVRRRRPLESHDRAHVHVRGLVLQVQEGRVEPRQPVVRHASQPLSFPGAIHYAARVRR